MALSLRFGAFSDIGRTRKKNDDSGYAGPNFVMVADGMGGAAAGDLASAVAVQTMQRLDAPAPDDMLEALAGAVQRSNDKMAELIDDDPAVEGMGTTVSAVLFNGHQIGVAHLGDSRGYLLHDGELLRITHDHTWVQSLIDEGRITEEEANVHSHRSLLLKVLDGRHDNDPDLTVYDVEAGDRILLCSDGLSGFVDPDRIARVLSIGTPESVAHELTQLALEAGSTDNVTVVVADVVDDAPTDDAPVIVGSATEPAKRGLGRLRGWGHRSDPDLDDAYVLEPDVDPEELRYAPRPPRRLLWLRRALTLAVVLALLGALGYTGYGWTQQQYYVASSNGSVAIYRGVQSDVPGITLHHVFALQRLRLSRLPSFRRSQVMEGMTAGNLSDARRIVRQLNAFASVCAALSATPTTSARSGSPVPVSTSSTGTTSSSVPTRGAHRSGGATSSPERTARTSSTRHPTAHTPGVTAQTTRSTETPRTEPTTRGQATTTTTASPPSRGSSGPGNTSAQECAGATPTTTETTR